MNLAKKMNWSTFSRVIVKISDGTQGVVNIMKKRICILMLCAIFLLPACSAPVEEEPRAGHIAMQFFSMNCEDCEAALVEIFANMGLTVLYASFEDDWIEFEFDPELYSIEEIKEYAAGLDAFMVALNELELPQDELNALVYAIFTADLSHVWDVLEEQFPSQFTRPQ